MHNCKQKNLRKEHAATLNEHENVQKSQGILKLKFNGKRYTLKSGLTLASNELGILTAEIN